MTINLEIGHIITVALFLIGGFAAFGKLLLDQVEKRLDTRFAVITAEMAKSELASQKLSAEWVRVDRDLMAIRVELAERYAKVADVNQIREDINAGFARLYDKLDGKVSTKDCETLRMSGQCAKQ